eukprot:TRINITY_DN79478_c0_g1_i1.p1 TRINITY_DN79478_c0_g1~~TRINITY_DN79478_c0_g1_i1.p1  ORF type:complete len:173 (+),score=20.35 TRINITY_DN79478_c0_g1_i1:25-519(+)
MSSTPSFQAHAVLLAVIWSAFSCEAYTAKHAMPQDTMTGVFRRDSVAWAQFQFRGMTTGRNITCTGFEVVWELAKKVSKETRTSAGIPGARYFKSVGPGPEFFALQTAGGLIRAWYHDRDTWFPYKSARSIICGPKSRPILTEAEYHMYMAIALASATCPTNKQ